MVIDTSALIAILENEPERRAFVEAIAADPVRLVSAGTVLEAGIVIESRRGEHAGRELDLLLHRAKVEVVPVDGAQVETARAAYRRYGKGRHAAGLNFGNCFAKSRGERLLFRGGDFLQTDIARASDYPQFGISPDARPIKVEETLDAEEE